MKTQRWQLMLVVLLLMAATLSCGLFGGSDGTPEAAAPSPLAENNPEAESETPPQGADESQASQPSAPQVNLGDEYRSEMGGYVFRAIPGYEVEEAFGFASMAAPDADSEKGPTFLLIGGASDEPLSTEELFNEFMEKPDEEDVAILEQREVTVDGKPGILAELEGKDKSGETIRVRVVLVSVSDTQQFTMIATAPLDRWGEIAANFDPLLASVAFFEPQEMSLDDLDEMLEETPDEASGDEETGDSGDYNFSDLGDLSNFPSQASDLPPGGFAVLLADTNGTLVLVGGEQAQPQPAADEYIILLTGEAQRNSLTLYLPHSLGDMLVMVPYDANAPAHAPGATIQLGDTLYTSTDGIIMVEQSDGKTISGSMFFVAVDENGAELSISGFFNELPLMP